MLFAVISDVQANFAALRAVLDDLRTNHPGVERVMSAGDAVGRGPCPNEVLDTFRAEGIESARGNYDDAVAFDRPSSGMDFPTREEEDVDNQALAWTRSQLTPANLELLRSFPRDLRLSPAARGVKVERNSGDQREREYRRNFFLRALFGGLIRAAPASSIKRILVVHGSPRAYNEFIRADTAASILAAVNEHAQTDVLVVGHAGISFQRDAGDLTVIGVGRVSGPIEPHPVAQYVILDVATAVQAQFVEVEYDGQAHRNAMQSSGLPVQLTDGFL